MKLRSDQSDTSFLYLVYNTVNGKVKLYFESRQSMEFRYLKKSDVEAYRLLRLQSLQTDPTGFVSTYPREIHMPIERFEDRIGMNERHFTMGVFDGGKLIGYATFYRETLEKIKHRGNLVGVYCDPQYRKQGFTQQLIQKMIDIVSEQGVVKTIGLSVLAENQSAINLYEKLGFQRYGTEPKALYDGKRYYDEDLMVLFL